ncbi:MAG: CC0125/CC1285 family lipoprotein [Acinetobacter sp.]
MKQLLLGAALGLSLALAGCATTPSKPLTFDQLGKFESIPLNAQTFRISFRASPNMSFGTAEEITLVKAAQATVQNGFQFFKVLDDPSNRTQQPPRQAVVYPAPSPYPYGYGRRYPGFWPDPFYDMPRVVTLDPTQVAYTIECFKNEKTAPKDAFDARLILQSLGAKYGLSRTGEILPAPAAPAPSK